MPDNQRPTEQNRVAPYLTSISAYVTKTKPAPAASSRPLLNVFPGLILSIDGVDPSAPRIDSQAQVKFTLFNGTNKSTSGNVGVNWGGAFRIADLGPLNSVSNSITTKIDKADKEQLLLLKYIEDNAPLVGEFPVVAAEDQQYIVVRNNLILAGL
jgi:hypothetical protein